jgi:hypothetical protein
MYFASILVAGAMLWDSVEGHGGIPGAPKLFGKRTSIKAKSRRQRLEDISDRGLDRAIAGSHLDSRANANGQCGPKYGSCALGICCSASG